MSEEVNTPRIEPAPLQDDTGREWLPGFKRGWPVVSFPVDMPPGSSRVVSIGPTGMTPRNESSAYESPTAQNRAQWTHHGTTKTHP